VRVYQFRLKQQGTTMEYVVVILILLMVLIAGIAFMAVRRSHQKFLTVEKQLHQQVEQASQDSARLTSEIQQYKQQVSDNKRRYLNLISSILEKSADDAEITSNDIDKIITTIRQFSSSMDGMQSATVETTTTANQGIEKTLEVQESLTLLKKSSDDLNDMLTKFSAINDKTEAIRFIGEEAEMLALNAAIEAARAGEAGRGFSVVADSMKELAKKSQETSVDILTIVQQSNQVIHAVASDFEQRGDALSISVQELIQNFNVINQAIEEIDQQVAEFNDNLLVKKQVTEQVSGAVKTSVETLVKQLSSLVSMISEKYVVDLSPTEVQQQWGDFDEVIDVRRDAEWHDELGHISGVTFSTLQTDFKDYVKQLDKNKRYLFVCRSGGRSTKAAQMALGLGIEQVFNLAGGMLEWRKQGL
jgi:methyl-accepting chemotaxis protein